jgi:midasin
MFEFYSPARSQVLPDVRKKMKLILFNLYRYFDQFSVAVEDEKANMRKPIEDKLKDFMKISRWDDASYYRLEKSAETSHRQLNKFTRDYEDRVLKLPFAAVMARQMGSLGGVPNEAFATPELTKEEFMSPAAVSDALTATSALKEHVKIHQRTSTLLGLESGEVVYSKLLGKMQRIICGDVFEAASRVSFVSSTADELASAIISRSQELRALTESNAGVQKRRAFRSLLKELDRQGVDYHSTAVKMDQSTLALLAEDNADPAARRLLHRQTLAMQSGATMGIDQAFTTLWHNADDYHYRVLSRLVTFRDLQAQYNRDLSSAEVRKLNGYIEHSLFMLLQQRRQLAESISQHEKLFALVHNGMSSTMDPSTDMALPHQAIRALLLSQKQAIDALCAQLEVLQQMLPACGGAARQLTPTVSSQLARLLQRKLASDSIINYLTDDNTENLLSRSTGLATGATVNAALANSAAIDDCVEFIKTTVVASVPHGFISSLARVASATAANLSAQMTRVRTQVQTSGEPPAKDISIAVDFKAKLDEVIRYIKLGVQHAKTNFASVSALVGREEARGAPEPETDAMDTDQPVEQPAPEEKPEEENDEDIQLLARSEHSLRTLLAQMHANAIASSLAELISVLDNSSLSASVHSACTLALRYHWPLLHQYLKLHSMVLRCMAMTHRSSYKLHYVLMNTFISLLRDGFCAPGKDGGEPAEGDVLTGVGGTGLGEGEGEKDISDQMDQLTEDQIMGQKDEEEHKPKDKNDEPVDRDTGVEMENDFDGEMKDVKSVEEDSEDEKDDNEKEPDREMGDVDPNKEDVVDEKLWNSDDEDEDEDDKKDSEKPEEKFEKDAPMPNNDKRDTEMSAKNDDTKDRNDKNQDQADDDNKDAPEQPEERPDPHGSESDSEPEEFPEINEDGDDKYEDNHHIKPHEEEKEFELPEDLNLDNHEDNGMEEGEDDSQDEGEGEENPNDIDKFPEQPDEPEGGDEGAEPPQEEQPGDEANEEGDQEIPQPEKGTHAVEDEDAMDEDKPDGDDEQEEPEIEANLQQQDQKMEDQPEAYGVQDNIGLPQQRIKNKDNQPNDDNKKQNEDEQEQDAANQDLQTADPSSGDAVASHQPDDTQSNTQQRERDPNPLRSLGDVLRHWRKKLEVVRDAADDAKDDTQEATQQQDQVDEEPTGDDNAAYEFVEQDQVADNQTMAAATEEQASKMDANMDHVAEEEEEQVSKDQEGEAEGEKDQMDVETKPPASEDRVLPKSGTAQMKEPTKDSTGDENTDEVMPDDAMDVEEENDDELEAARKRDVERASSGAKQEHSNAPDSEQDLEFKQLTPEDLVDMRQALEHEIAQWRNQPDQVALVRPHKASLESWLVAYVFFFTGCGDLASVSSYHWRNRSATL